MTTVLDQLVDAGVVAVLRGFGPDDVPDIVDALVRGGVTAIEITVDSPDAIDTIAMLSDATGSGREANRPGNDIHVGAGTVLDAETAHECLDAGASFVVSPVLEMSVVDVCIDRDVLVAPGIMTPTEALNAIHAGAPLLKVFPASTLGPGHLSALGAPLPDVPLMPTGGVTPESAPSYVAAGADLVGAGSALVDREAVRRGDFGEIEARARRFVEAVENGRQSQDSI